MAAFTPNDPQIVENILAEVKRSGLFDQFRKECISDVDTKPAYQNLKFKVENTVTTFLGKQKWTPDTNRNQLRERLRKNALDASYLDSGIEQIVDQVLHPKMSGFKSQVEELFYSHLKIDRPKRMMKGINEPVDSKDDSSLLPNDLETVSSPESDKIKSGSCENLNKSLEEDDFESPAFELLEGVKKEGSPADSHFSGISGLTSHSSEKKLEIKLDSSPVIENADTELSVVSSGSRLSIVLHSEKDTSPKPVLDIAEEAQMPEFNENSNSVDVKPSCSTETKPSMFDFKKEEIEFKGTNRLSLTLDEKLKEEIYECENKHNAFKLEDFETNSHSTDDIKLEIDENAPTIASMVDEKPKHEAIEAVGTVKTEEKSESTSASSIVKTKEEDRRKSHHKPSKSKHSSRDRDDSDRRRREDDKRRDRRHYSSSHKSRHSDRPSESKERTSDRPSDGKERHSESKDRHSESKDRHRTESSKSRHDSHRKDSHRDKEKDKEREKDRDHDRKHRRDSSKDRKDRSTETRKDRYSSTKDKRYSSKERSDTPKVKSDSTKESTERHSSHKKDRRSHSSSKDQKDTSKREQLLSPTQPETPTEIPIEIPVEKPSEVELKPVETKTETVEVKNETVEPEKEPVKPEIETVQPEPEPVENSQVETIKAPKTPPTIPIAQLADISAVIDFEKIESNTEDTLAVATEEISPLEEYTEQHLSFDEEEEKTTKETDPKTPDEPEASLSPTAPKTPSPLLPVSIPKPPETEPEQKPPSPLPEPSNPIEKTPERKPEPPARFSPVAGPSRITPPRVSSPQLSDDEEDFLGFSEEEITPFGSFTTNRTSDLSIDLTTSTPLRSDTTSSPFVTPTTSQLSVTPKSTPTKPGKLSIPKLNRSILEEDSFYGFENTSIEEVASDGIEIETESKSETKDEKKDESNEMGPTEVESVKSEGNPFDTSESEDDKSKLEVRSEPKEDESEEDKPLKPSVTKKRKSNDKSSAKKKQKRAKSVEIKTIEKDDAEDTKESSKSEEIKPTKDEPGDKDRNSPQTRTRRPSSRISMNEKKSSTLGLKTNRRTR